MAGMLCWRAGTSVHGNMGGEELNMVGSAALGGSSFEKKMEKGET